MDGRAEKSLQVQGVCVLQVGVGNSGILRVSSGSAVAVNPARNRWAPNALVLNKTQEQSKMSQSVHVKIGKVDATTNADRRRVIRTIGVVQPSCITPERWQNPGRNRQGGVVDLGDGSRGPGGNGLRDNSLCASVSYRNKRLCIASDLVCMSV